MNLVFAPQAWEDYLYWQATDKKMVRRIHELLKDTVRSPFEGIGKPEPLNLKTEMAEGESAAVIGPTRLPASRVASPDRCNRCEPGSLVEPSTTPSSSLSLSVSRLKHAFSGYWSRRIDSEHRFVYRVTEHGLMIAQLRLHY